MCASARCPNSAKPSVDCLFLLLIYAATALASLIAVAVTIPCSDACQALIAYWGIRSARFQAQHARNTHFAVNFDVCACIAALKVFVIVVQDAVVVTRWVPWPGDPLAVPLHSNENQPKVLCTRLCTSPNTAVDQSGTFNHV